ncbi:UDP-glucosyltransferase 45 [Psilocybe cubensis]|uniref:UDP-glucosyltransferase 45 n=2 Tax=Psilocybe cubensis TaxID=181762 RepID=A0ACB8GKG8_PSICU|nr:UDP-glucosyltransferase 45 [Psilocybe cubensis]KAH9476166.1 UDP-glucosyltransferase 45 [Psilocybe cubensis]
MTHIFFSAFPAWGHLRALCILAARLVKENKNLTVTLLLPPNHLKKAVAEITAEFGGESSENNWKRLRAFSPFKLESEHPLELVQLMVACYPTVYQQLLNSQSITCSITGDVFDSILPPDMVILDFFAHPQLLATREATGTKIPIAVFVCAHAATILRTLGPEHYGGRGDLNAKIEAEAARRGITPLEVGDSVYSHTDGTIIKIAGIPDMYDWEYFPQLLPFDLPVSQIMIQAYRGLRDSDVIISGSAQDFEPETLEAFKSWFTEWNKKVYVVGPLIPSKPTTFVIPSNDAQNTGLVETFLDKALAEHGRLSTVLLSFGSLFWPHEQGYLEEVIEALIEKKFPFIVSYASPFAKISDDLLERVQSSGYGLIARWLPQLYVLNHPATGWFITHSGQNGVLEALGTGVPMICWPFEADQPAAAAHLSENLKVAFELLEVRTGERGLKPLLRNGRQAKGTREAVGIEIRDVLDACRGEKGAELRKNAQAIKAKFDKTWQADGISRKDFNACLEQYGIHLS